MIPQDMKDAQFITLSKNKESGQDCKDNQAISLLSLAGKLFGRVILGRLWVLAGRVYLQNQCGFSKNRSTIDMVFMLRLLQ